MCTSDSATVADGQEFLKSDDELGLMTLFPHVGDVHLAAFELMVDAQSSPPGILKHYCVDAEVFPTLRPPMRIGNLLMMPSKSGLQEHRCPNN